VWHVRGYVAKSALVAVVLALIASPVTAAPSTGDGWHLLAPVPAGVRGPVFALDANPFAGAEILIGASDGVIYRSSNGGEAWQAAARNLGQGVLALAYSPYQRGVVLAGVRDGGIWRSLDAGATWSKVPGASARTVRSFAFTPDAVAAGSDSGVLMSRDGLTWTPIGPAGVDVSTLAMTGVGPASILAGSDSGSPGAPLALYASPDQGRSWKPVAGPFQGSTMVDALGTWTASGQTWFALGTNAGAFSSGDGGQSWTSMGGSGSLPASDVTSLKSADHPNDFYVASDGGASGGGGLWATRDGGQHFESLKLPLATVTGFTVVPDAQPLLYAASLRPLDHALFLWSYQDHGASPTGTSDPVPPMGSQRGPNLTANPDTFRLASVLGPELPFLVAAGAALLILLLVGLTRWRESRRESDV
jgi:photosystem II stability/assembly factor-like uncharacterized protein